jgi:hypothetical protein
MKKILLVTLILLNAAALQANYIKDYPVTLEQPDGTKVSCFLSGDEYYNWVHDVNGYSFIRDAQGYIVYAKLELVSAQYRASSFDGISDASLLMSAGSDTPCPNYRFYLLSYCAGGTCKDKRNEVEARLNKRNSNN